MGQSGYQYDANGNLIDDGKRSYQWDAADRLIEITDKQTGHTSQFAYDGLNRRISETETDQGGSPITTRFQWCGERICAKRDENDTVQARYYSEGELHGTQPLYYAQDQVGSVVAVVNGQGQVIGRISYDSYGNVIQQQGTLPDYRYAGLYAHAESGLYLATYRAYDPETARWLSRDPIRESGGINLYRYANGHPLRYLDSLGLTPNPAEAACIAGPNPVCVAGAVGDVATTVVGIGIIVYNHYHNESAEADTCPVSKDKEPNHPDYTPHKKNKGLQKIPWNKNKKGFPDSKGRYWEPVPDGHKGTHDPHWDVQLPSGDHIPVYPVK